MSSAKERWRALAGDADLSSHTEDDLPIEPIYTLADACSASERPMVEPEVAVLWEDLHDPVELAGAAALLFRPRRFDAFPLLPIPIALDPGVRWIEGTEAFLGRGLRGSAGADPIGACARGAPLGPSDWDRFAAFAKQLGPSLARTSGAPYADAGATACEQLAMTVAAAIDTGRALFARGVAWPGPTALHVVLDADLFAGIALLRAIRIVWASRAARLGLEPRTHVHAETARRIVARRDPEVNMIRGTLTCFAAICGGADRVTVLPFDRELPNPSELGRRIARNTGLILLEEAHLGRVHDPAGGSFFVERLTKAFVDRAEAIIGAIEDQGGMVSALRSGWVKARVDASARRRRERLAERRDVIIGVTEQPDPRRPPGVPRTGPPDAVRSSAPFEDLRDRLEGARIFLALLGPARDRAARTAWTEGVLAVGGLEPVRSTELLDAGAAAAAFAESGCKAAILCGSDATYEAIATSFAGALRSRGARVFLAGRPKDPYRDAADGFVHAGADILAFLEGVERSLA